VNSTTYLRDLAERLRAVPAAYAVDQGDVDRLVEIARKFDNMVAAINRIERERNARLDHNLGDE
jgi:hypothetical protein